MPAGTAVDEAHVREDRCPAEVEAHRQLPAGHLVLEQGDRAVLPERAGRGRPRVRGDEELGHDAQYADLGPPHVLRGQGAVDHAAGVGGEIGPLEPRAELGHDAVVRHPRAAGELGVDRDQLVELDQRRRLQHDVERAGVALDGAVDEPDAPGVVTVAHAARPSRLCCSTDSRTARSASRESPCR